MSHPRTCEPHFIRKRKYLRLDLPPPGSAGFPVRAPIAASVRGILDGMRPIVLCCFAVGCGLATSGCGSTAPDSPLDAPAGSPDSPTAPGDGSAAATPQLPPLNAAFDYQLGGAYAPPTGVTIVSRDRTAAIAPGLYNICYVNGFQIQPGEASVWQSQHADLILRTANGSPVIDAEWNEMLIDVSTPAKRTQVAAIAGDWITGCQRAGFAAVEIDNLDSYTRSQGLLSEDNAVAMMRAMSDAAHAAGLAIAQKNSTDLVARKAELGTDFVVAEQCNEFSECDAYRAGYGDHVLVIEYAKAAFDTGCTAFPALSIVLRDRELVKPGDSGYVYQGC